MVCKLQRALELLNHLDKTLYLTFSGLALYKSIFEVSECSTEVLDTLLHRTWSFFFNKTNRRLDFVVSRDRVIGTGFEIVELIGREEALERSFKDIHCHLPLPCMIACCAKHRDLLRLANEELVERGTNLYTGITVALSLPIGHCSGDLGIDILAIHEKILPNMVCKLQRALELLNHLDKTLYLTFSGLALYKSIFEVSECSTEVFNACLDRFWRFLLDEADCLINLGVSLHSIVGTGLEVWEIGTAEEALDRSFKHIHSHLPFPV